MEIPTVAKAVANLQSHQRIIQGIVRVSTKTGLERFRAAAWLTSSDVKQRRHRLSWDFLKEHFDLRRRFVYAQAQQLLFDNAVAVMQNTPPGTQEAHDEFTQVQNETPEWDQAVWLPLAEMKYRRTIMHL